MAEDDKPTIKPLNEVTLFKRSTDQASALILHESQVTLKSYDKVEKLLDLARKEMKK